MFTPYHPIQKMVQDILSFGIKGIAQMLDSRLISSKELCELCLQRIRNTKKFNQFISLNTKYNEEAARSDERLNLGKKLSMIDGIPVSMKDNFCTKDLKTTCSSNILRNYIPPYYSTVAYNLENAGGVLIGKTNMDEFAMGSGTIDGVFGPVINPLAQDSNEMAKDLSDDEWYISGGSSGGGAVAVATGSCFASVTSDTGGSTRNPASRVGIVGFKPSYGLISRSGLIPLTHSTDVPGILARSVEDVYHLFKVLNFYDNNDSTSVKVDMPLNLSNVNLSSLKVGIPKEYNNDKMSLDIINSWNECVKTISGRGAKVVSISLKNTKYATPCYSIINACEVSSNFACYDGIEFGSRSEGDFTEELYASTRYKGFNDIVKGRILAGNYFLLKENYNKYYIKAAKVRRLIYNDFMDAFRKEGIDMILTPVTLTPAIRYSEYKKKDNRERVVEEDYCTQPVNLAGLPAISIPWGRSKEGFPIGIQCITDIYKDIFLLSIAQKLELLKNNNNE